jgi:hypothetical protein
MTDTFVQRLLYVTISLGLGPQGLDGTKDKTFYGPRVSADIVRNGMPGNSTAAIRIFGLSMDDMNAVTSLGKPKIQDRFNSITVYAGDMRNGMSVAFSGTIMQAWADFAGMPDIVFTVEAQAGRIDAMRPVPPLSFPGSVDAADVLKGLAKQLGYAFENNGVSVILSNPYYPGTAADQIHACLTEADIYGCLDDTTHALAIWPKTASRGGQIPLISPDTGMIGYPAYVEGGLNLLTLYNPAILFAGQIQVQSSLPQACGTWVVNKLVHHLATITPDGPWFTEIGCWRLGDPNPNVLSK